MTTCQAACESSCEAQSPNNSTTSTLFRSDWYSLASGTTLYTLWAGYTGLWVIFSLAFWYSSHIQPIKSRSPQLVLVSGFGGWLLVTDYAMAHYVTGIERWPCPYTNWSLWLALPLFLVPLPLRSLQLYFIFKHNVDKVKAHKKTGEEVTKRVTVVERRFTESRAKAMTARAEGSGVDGTDAVDSIEAAKARSQAAQNERKRGRNTGKNVTIMESDDSGMDIMHADSGEFGRGTGGSGVKRKQRNNTSFAMSLLMRAPSKLGPITVETIDTMRDQLGMDPRTKFFRHFPTIIFIVTLTTSFIVGITRQFIPELQLGPECVGCMVGLSQGTIETIVVVIMLALQIFAVTFIRVSQVVDQYRIATELQIISIMWTTLLIPACALALTASDCELLRLSEPSCSTFNSFTQECYFKVAASNWVEVVCIILTFFVTILVPVVVSHLNGRQKMKNEPPKFFWPNVRVLKSLTECLKDTEAHESFQRFCISCFCVQNVLFWTDIEHYRSIMDANELRIRAVAIYRQYMTASGNLFLELPDDMQVDMDNKLESFAMADNSDFDYTFEADPRLFDLVQAEIFRQMESDAFPRYVRSEDAKKLVSKFKDRLVQNVGMMDARLL